MVHRRATSREPDIPNLDICAGRIRGLIQIAGRVDAIPREPAEIEHLHIGGGEYIIQLQEGAWELKERGIISSEDFGELDRLLKHLDRLVDNPAGRGDSIDDDIHDIQVAASTAIVNTTLACAHEQRTRVGLSE